MTKRLLVLTLLLAVVAVPVYADFNRIARALDSQDGMKRIWIPFLGLARFFVRTIHPEGVHDFQFATFEGGRDIDPRVVHALFASKLDPTFRPLVQVRSNRRGGEWVFIYARPKGDTRMEMMMLVKDGDDTVLVRVDVDPEIILRELDEPRNVSRAAMHR